MPRVIVTAPLVRALRRVVVDSAGSSREAPARILRETTELGAHATDAALAARDAGADVVFFGLCEPGTEAALRARLEPRGIRCVLHVVPAASAGTTVFEHADGSVRLAISDARLPAAADLDRLLDDVAAELLFAAAFVLVVGDLDGSKRPDYGERVVGRAWGLGFKSFLATDMSPLKQAYHTYPYGLLVRHEDVASVCAMPRTPKDETDEQALERSFSESMQVFAIRTGPTSCLLAAHDARFECATAASDARIAGTIAALAAAHPHQPAEVVRRAADALRGVAEAVTPVPVLERGVPR